MYSSVNVIYLLFFIMILITAITAVLLDFDFLQPAVIVDGMMTFSLFIALFKVSQWGLQVNLNTAFVVIAALLSFSIASFYSHWQCRKFSFSLDKNIFSYNIPNFNYFKITFLIVVMVIFLYMNAREMYELSLSLGNTGGYTNMIKTVRYPLERGEITLGTRFTQYRTYFAMVCAFVSFYIFVANVLSERKIAIENFLYLLPMIVYFPFTILTTGRYEMIRMVVFQCLTFCILYLKKHGFKPIYVKYTFLLFVIGMMIIVGLFLVMGMLTGKGLSDSRPVFDVLAHYIGLSIPALNQFLYEIPIENNLIGQNTLVGIYGNLNSLGFNLKTSKNFLEFVQFTGIDTNVYTMIRREISDYGYVGMVLVLYFWGLVFTFLYEKIKNIGQHSILIIFYCTNVYVLFLLFHTERFMELITTKTLYQFLLTILLYSFLKDRFLYRIKEKVKRAIFARRFNERSNKYD